MAIGREPEPAALADHLGYWLRMVSNQVSHAFAARLGTAGVTVAEWVALRVVLDHDAITPSRLADEMQMTKGAISKLSDRLVAKHLVERIDHPTDGRVRTLRLTARGRHLVPELARLADANDDHFFGHLTVRQRRDLERVLRDLARQHGSPTPVD